MERHIAWVRLTIYFGLGLLLLSELIRLILIYIGFVIQFPALFAIIENFVLWLLCAGNIILALGLYKLLKSTPPLLNLIEEYSKSNLINCIRALIGITVILIFLLLLPPTSSFQEDFKIIGLLSISLCWVFYYSFNLIFIDQFWLFRTKSKFNQIFKTRNIAVHSFFGIIQVFLWFVVTLCLLIINRNLFTIESFYLIHSISLIFFLMFQVYYYIRATKFAFLIFG